MIEQTVTEYLINALWQMPLLAAGAWFLMRMIKPAAQIQYCVWLAVLGAAILLPLRGITLRAETSQPLAAENARQTPAALRRPIEHALPRQHPLSLLPYTHTVRVRTTYLQWLVRLYLATVIFALLRIARAWRAGSLLANHAQGTCAYGTVLRTYSRQLGIRTPEIRESAAIESPMIAGITSPLLLLPLDFARFTEEQVSAALCHELAHIKRRDPLVNLGCQLAMVPMIWHPAMHLIQHEIRMAREMACDALAAHQMNSELSYAKCLLALAHSMLGTRTARVQNQYIALFGANTLEKRIMRLAEKTTMNLQARLSRAVIGAAMMSASCVLAATLHLEPVMQNPAAGQSAQPAGNLSASSPVSTQAEAPLSAENKPASRHHHALRTQPAWNPQQTTDFKRQLETARQQAATAAALFNSEAFKKQMEEAQRQANSASDFVNNPRFRQQIEDAQKQAAQTKELFNTPEFKQQIENAKRQARETSELVNSQQFKLQMEEMQKKIAEAMKDFHPEMVQPPSAP